MNVFAVGFEVIKEWIRSNYLSALAIMAASSGIAVFILVDQILRKLLIFGYGVRVKAFKKARAVSSEQRRRFPKMPSLSGGGLSVQRLSLLGGVALGLVAAVLAFDPLLSISFLICFPILGYALTMGMGSAAFITRRVQLYSLLKMMIDDLEAFQSTQKACYNLSQHYLDLVPEGKRDADFMSKLRTLNELSASDQNLNDVVTDLFAASEIYKPISDIVNFAAETGPASAVDYARIVIKKGTMWKNIITSLQRQVTGIRFTALVLEALLIAGIFATFPTTLGDDMSNMLHDYFFSSLQGKLFLVGILVAHTVVEYGFMDFLRINTESI